ncbi:MAG: thioesterase family protein [Deltaproteobacteria bacterium]|nr:thioesterase family protein [Deltaproteobacteria bacterium]MBW2359863.1 thioesterase family protein [Deltaproteobacteria bacterium]
MSAPEVPAAGSPSFSDQAKVTPDAATPGRFHAELDRSWATPLFPSGGLAAGVALRAMQAVLPNPEHRVRTMTTLFVSTVRDGPVEIDVELLRPGKRMTHLRATLRNAGSGEAGHITTAAFGESRPGFDFSYTPAPEVTVPEDYPERAEPPPGVPTFRAAFFDQTETRGVDFHHSWETDWEGGRAEATRWIRYRNSPRLGDGTLDPLALPALADTMPPALMQYLGPGYPFFHCPSVDLTVHFYAATRSEWLISHTRCHWAGDGYASAEIQLWDEERRLVCHATQVMLLRFPAPESLGAG